MKELEIIPLENSNVFSVILDRELVGSFWAKEANYTVFTFNTNDPNAYCIWVEDEIETKFDMYDVNLTLSIYEKDKLPDRIYSFSSKKLFKNMNMTIEMVTDVHPSVTKDFYTQCVLFNIICLLFDKASEQKKFNLLNMLPKYAS